MESLQDADAAPQLLQRIQRAAAAAAQRVASAEDASMPVVVGLHLRARLEALVDTALAAAV